MSADALMAVNPTGATAVLHLGAVLSFHARVACRAVVTERDGPTLRPSLPLVLSSVLRVVSLPLSGAHLAYSP